MYIKIWFYFMRYLTPLLLFPQRLSFILQVVNQSVSLIQTIVTLNFQCCFRPGQERTKRGGL